MIHRLTPVHIINTETSKSKSPREEVGQFNGYFSYYSLG